MEEINECQKVQTFFANLTARLKGERCKDSLIITELQEFDEDLFDLDGNPIPKEAIGDVPPKMIVRCGKESIVINFDALNTNINGGTYHPQGIAYHLSPEIPEGEEVSNLISKPFIFAIFAAMYDVAIGTKQYIEIGIEINGDGCND